MPLLSMLHQSAAAGGMQGNYSGNAVGPLDQFTERSPALGRSEVLYYVLPIHAIS
jgi:hypothetical protein